MFENPSTGEMPESKWVPGPEGEELEIDLSGDNKESEEAKLRAREGQRSSELQVAAEAAAELMEMEARKKAAAEALEKMEENGTVN